jgi:phosphoserine phosphatase
LEHKKNRSVVELIKSYNNKNYKLAIVSATLDFIAESVSQRFSIPLVFSTKLVYDENETCRGKIESDLLGKKLKFLKENKLADKYSVVITDDYSDKNLFCMNTKNYVVTSAKKVKKWQNFAKKQNIQIEFIF